MSSNQNITTKLCIYGCGLNLYWNTTVNEYWEVFTKKKHICPNRLLNNNNNYNKKSRTPSTTNSVSKPTYYNNYKKSYYSNQPKPKMSISLELLQGPIVDVQRKYEDFE